jgi:hypothetical protein
MPFGRLSLNSSFLLAASRIRFGLQYPSLLSYKAHLASTLRVFYYLQGTKTLGLTLRKGDGELILEAAADFDFAGEPEENDNPMKSIKGSVGYFKGIGPVHYDSSLQSCIARSTGEAEYMNCGKTAQFCSGFRQLLEEVGFKQEKPTTILADNQASIAMVKSRVSGSNTRHIKLQHHYIRELAETGEIEMAYCPTEEMVADIMTKALNTHQFCYLRDKILSGL